MVDGYLMHHGIKGQKWGVRRYQNEDGSLTPEGKIRYGSSNSNSIHNAREISKSISEKVKADSKPPTGNQNCQLCTWCAEAQFRGIKNAKPRPVYSPRDPELGLKGETIVKGATRAKSKNFNDLESKIRSIDGDARFYSHVNWEGSKGGHEFLIIKNGEEIYIMDPQAGETSSFNNKSEYLSGIDYKNSYISRLDDKPFDTKLFNEVNNQKPLEWNASVDIPYMYKEGMISKEEYEKEIKHSIFGIEDGHYLMHHGIKGQKWGVRRFQNYDGTLIKRSGTDMRISKESNLYRFSNKKEKGSLKGSYVAQTPSDTNEYYLDSKHTRLGFKNYDKIVMTKIGLIDDITVRRGRATVKDVVDSIGDKKVTDAYKYLDKIGFLDDNKSALERSKIWAKSKKAKDARNILGSAINKYTYNKKTSKDSRDSLIDKYSKMKYDAVVDPEDFVWVYERPMIIVNDNKFKRLDQITVYDKSYNDFLKTREDAFSNSKNKPATQWYEYNDTSLQDELKKKGK